jgi:hypothetical protein
MPDCLVPQPDPRLLDNYRRCLEWRLELWFGHGSLVEHEGLTLHVTWEQFSASMTMQPELCRWSLLSSHGVAEGSFDRMSKRMRQIFSGHA